MLTRLSCCSLQFKELQALAAQRSQAAQAKLAAERAERQRQETERKTQEDAKARARAAKEREMLIAREQKRKKEAEAKRLEEQRQREKAERREKERMEAARRSVQSGSPGKKANGNEAKGADMRKFSEASRKAFARAGGHGEVKRSKKHAAEEDENGFLSSPGGGGSVLTREEKRAKRQMAMLGLSGGSSSSRRKHGQTRHGARTSSSSSVQPDLVALGTVKRDHRSIDEIERDLHEAKRAKAAALSKGSKAAVKQQLHEEERQREELDAALRRERAMNEKRKAEGLAPVERVRIASSDAGRHRISDKTLSSLVQPSEHRRKVPDRQKTSLGLCPADYLPGAPIRADLIKERSSPERNGKHARRTGEEEKQGPIPVQEEDQEVAAPPKRKETARERFLREEQERKMQRLGRQAGSQRFEEDYEDEELDEDEAENDDDEYESEGVEATGADYRDEIWKLFGRKRSEYVACATAI